ncbi:hypothetical protein HPPN135_05525 [Helicobacter pylori Puno135]|nr:hypothetical protein HPPN135_05525 [Helicobacter pylori Puno135]
MKEDKSAYSLGVVYFKTTQAEIPNIFSVWDECHQFVV